jgi:quinol monooxygenase YgiN
MSEPIVFISHFKVKEGKLEGLKQLHQTVVEQIKTDKPGTVVFLHYLNEEGTEYGVIHVFPDAEAMDRHMEGAGERAKAAFEFLEPIGRELYGMPNAETLAMMMAIRPPGAPEIEFHHMPQSMGGYTRFKAE